MTPTAKRARNTGRSGLQKRPYGSAGRPVWQPATALRSNHLGLSNLATCTQTRRGG